jgi:transposase
VFDDATPKVRECDAQIEWQFAATKPRVKSDNSPPIGPRSSQGQHPKVSRGPTGRAHLLRLTGVELVAVTGSAASLAQTILSEVGTGMSRFPTVKRCCSWLGLAPHHDISGGRVLRSRTLRVVNRATHACR